MPATAAGEGLRLSVPALARGDPGNYGAGLVVSIQIASLHAIQRFNNSLFSCPNTGEQVQFFDDGCCYYLAVVGSRLERDRTSDLDGFDVDSHHIGTGGQLVLAFGAQLRAAFSYEHREPDGDSNNTNSDGYLVQFGLSAKRQYGQ